MDILVVEQNKRHVLTDVNRVERSENSIKVHFRDGSTRTFESATAITGSIVDVNEQDSGGD